MNKLPYWFLCFFVFTLPWQGVVVIPGIGTISRLLGFVLVGLAILYILINKNMKEVPLFIIASVLFVVWGLISYTWSYIPSATISRFIQSIQFLAMVWLVWELCDRKTDYKILLQMFIFGLFVTVADMLYSYGTQSYISGRMEGGGLGINRIAMYLSLGIPIAWYLYLSQKSNILSYINIVYIPLAIFSIILTGSRTGLIVGSIGLTIIPLTFFKLPSTSKITVIGFVSVCLLFSLFYYSKAIENLQSNIDRFSETPDMIQEGEFTGRQVFWNIALKKFIEKPIQGFGAATSSHIIGEQLGGVRRSSHNTYISILLESGIIGLLIMFSIIAIIIIPILLLGSIERTFGLVIIAVIMVTMIVNNLETDKTFWFILSIFMGYAFIRLNNRQLCVVKRI